MDRSQLLQHVTTLGKEFARRGMDRHAAGLRLYYLALRGGLADRQRRIDLHWSEDFVVEWMRLLQLSPHDGAYPIRPEGAQCERCVAAPGALSSVRTERVFAGGSKMRCDTCKAAWLVLDAPA